MLFPGFNCNVYKYERTWCSIPFSLRELGKVPLFHFISMFRSSSELYAGAKGDRKKAAILSLCFSSQARTFFG